MHYVWCSSTCRHAPEQCLFSILAANGSRPFYRGRNLYFCYRFTPAGAMDVYGGAAHDQQRSAECNKPSSDELHRWLPDVASRHGRCLAAVCPTPVETSCEHPRVMLAWAT